MANDEKKEMDVSKPGKTAPDTTGRPVIVGHKPLLQQDPMMNGANGNDADKSDVTADEEKITVHTAKVIEPPKEEIKAETKAETKEESPPAPEPEKPETPEPEKTEAEPSDEPVSEGSAVVDAVAEQAGANKKKEGELSEEEKKKQEAIQKLIEEKKYFVPIKVASRKRNARLSTIVLIILLILVAGYVALDMGLVDAGINLPIDLIKN